jgi:trans-aconitate methyltransferase
VLKQVLRDRRVDEVLDVGAGSGVFSRQLLDAAICNRAVCVDPNYQDEYMEVHNGREIRFLRSVKDVEQRLILMMDVLEHVDDAVALLRRYTTSLARGGRVFITVPAFQWLWSGHDLFLEHKRRYTLRQLENLVETCGLEVVDGRYFFGLLFPLAAALRLRDRARLNAGKIEARSSLRVYPHWFNQALVLLHDLERHLLFPFNRIVGLTVVCLAQK